jgi:hypothetical protein
VALSPLVDGSRSSGAVAKSKTRLPPWMEFGDCGDAPHGEADGIGVFTSGEP